MSESTDECKTSLKHPVAFQKMPVQFSTYFFEFISVLNPWRFLSVSPTKLACVFALQKKAALKAWKCFITKNIFCSFSFLSFCICTTGIFKIVQSAKQRKQHFQTLRSPKTLKNASPSINVMSLSAQAGGREASADFDFIQLGWFVWLTCRGAWNTFKYMVSPKNRVLMWPFNWLSTKENSPHSELPLLFVYFLRAVLRLLA